MRRVASEYTEKRLLEWATWVKRNGDGGLGYPRRSIEGRLQDEGGILSRTNYRHEINNNPEIEEIENLIIELSRNFSAQAAVIITEYLSNDSVHIKAARLKMARTQYVVYHDIAKAWIDGYLHAEKD